MVTVRVRARARARAGAGAGARARARARARAGVSLPPGGSKDGRRGRPSGAAPDAAGAEASPRSQPQRPLMPTWLGLGLGLGLG